MLATLVDDDDHFTTLVMSCVLPSENVPVAVNCWLTPRGFVGLSGVTAIETAEAVLTVREVEPLTGPCDAEIVAVPPETARAKPIGGGVLLGVATAVSEEDQLTDVVRF